jgi:hypothetical protein
MGKRERRRQRERRLTTNLALRRRWPNPPPRADHLRELVVQRDALREEIENEVERLADAGTSWPAIAAALGVSRQAARQAALRRHSGRRTSR